jgi:hypothetical protein
MAATPQVCLCVCVPVPKSLSPVAVTPFHTHTHTHTHTHAHTLHTPAEPVVPGGCACNATQGAQSFVCPAGFRCSKDAYTGVRVRVRVRVRVCLARTAARASRRRAQSAHAQRQLWQQAVGWCVVCSCLRVKQARATAHMPHCPVLSCTQPSTRTRRATRQPPRCTRCAPHAIDATHADLSSLLPRMHAALDTDTPRNPAAATMRALCTTCD